MAGIKITNLVSLTVPASDDLLYIVDVSDLTDSPEGTSKKIEVGDLGIGGDWTPTVSGFNGAISNATIDVATYSKCGNMITCAIQGILDVDFSADTNGQFDFTKPLAGINCVGTANIEFPNQCNGIVKGNGRVSLGSNDTTLVGSGVSYCAIFQYTES
jgi:hypothetical protein